MLIRVIFLLLCAAGFINSCNSLISLQIGTHKLRSFTMDEIAKEGIKDADFIEIRDASIPATYVHVPIERKGDKDLIIFAVESPTPQTTGKAPIKVIGWQQKKDATCIQTKNCLDPGVRTIRGVVRPIKKRRDLSGQLTDKLHYQLSEIPIFIEVGQAPVAWYWHLLVLALTAGGVLLVEAKRK